MSIWEAEDDSSPFGDVLAANWEFQWQYDGAPAQLPLRAGRGLAVVMCADGRIEPLESMGLALGDALILRNMGGQVNDNVMTALVLAVHQLDVTRIIISQHTQCALTIVNPDAVRAKIAAATGHDASSFEIPTIADQWARLRDDVARVRASIFMPERIEIIGVLFDLKTGFLMTSPDHTPGSRPGEPSPG